MIAADTNFNVVTGYPRSNVIMYIINKIDIDLVGYFQRMIIVHVQIDKASDGAK